ncbi:DUF3392 family protein [Pseudoalteromonas distincta]|uniref:DUF3392 family protein n=1 Tax=Pseudoalteromonas distincta TaxID=77608 RepID=UPI0039E8FB65
MDSVLHFLNTLQLSTGQWLLGYVNNIAMLFTVCLVSLYANDVIKLTKSTVSRYNFVVRVLCFVLITAFGFGFMVVWLSPLIAKGLLFFGKKWLTVTLIIAFFVLGTIADKKNQL